MSQPSRLPSLIPESAPFSTEQRVWLNGLFTGMFSLEHGITPLSPEQVAAPCRTGSASLKEPPPKKPTTAPLGTTRPWRSRTA